MANLVVMNDNLRLYDNPALLNATMHNKPIICVVLEDKKITGAAYYRLIQAFNTLQAQLNTNGIPCIYWKGSANELCDVLKQNGIIVNAIYYNEYHGASGALVNCIVPTMRYEGNILHAGIERLFQRFTPFGKYCRTLPVSTPVPAPKFLTEHAITLPFDTTCNAPNHVWGQQMARHYHVGEINAQERWRYFVQNHLTNYGKNRDFMGIDGTSMLSTALRFGEISIRQMWYESSDVVPFTNELLWRDFAYHLLEHKPDMAYNPIDQRFANMPWQHNDKWLEKWQKGQTGYPIIDAGMRQLWQTGWLHNRVRMIVGSFLCKNLLLPWQLGHDWFFDTLTDADFASNAMNWQWVAGCGCDAAPYFRIFNPTLQGWKFDPQGVYVKRYVPELAKVPTAYIHEPWKYGFVANYPAPIVDLYQSREKALEAFASIKNSNLV